MSVEVSHVTKIFGLQHALDDVSFSVKPGEVVGLLGPNGAGKSTLMKIITCFIPPSTGTIRVMGFDVMLHSVQVRQKLGYLPENNPLYADLYIREYLSFIAGIYKLGKRANKRISEIVEITGLMPEQHKKIGALSKGYRQRVGLAQALIHDPDVLIMDEPTSGLDPNQLIEIRNLIKMIGREKTVMLSTHVMQEVEAICDRAIIIDQGKIIADGHPGQLSKLTTDQDIILVEFSGPVQGEELELIPGVLEVTHVSGNTFRLRSGASSDIRPLLFNFAVDASLTVLSLSRQDQGLEKVFQELTRKSAQAR